MTPNEIADALEKIDEMGLEHAFDFEAIRAAIAHLRAPAALPELPPLFEATPMKEHPLGGQVEAFRMDAYYYGFAATGIKAIDLILSAVACAGKSFHHTEQWNEDCGEPYHDLQRGKTPVEWIQNAADDAAAAIRAYALAALAGREQDAADAARYRHLVATCNIGYAPEEPWQLVIWEPNSGEDWKAKLDAAIDAAMEAKHGMD